MRMITKLVLGFMTIFIASVVYSNSGTQEISDLELVRGSGCQECCNINANCHPNCESSVFGDCVPNQDEDDNCSQEVGGAGTGCGNKTAGGSAVVCIKAKCTGDACN